MDANCKHQNHRSIIFWLRSSYCLVVGMINFGFQFYGVVLGSSRCFETDVFSRPYQLYVGLYLSTFSSLHVFSKGIESDSDLRWVLTGSNCLQWGKNNLCIWIRFRTPLYAEDQEARLLISFKMKILVSFRICIGYNDWLQEENEALSYD